MSDIINQNTEPLFIFDMPDDETLSETISVKGEKGERGDPTKLSDLENDEGFITANTDELVNYYKKAEVDAAIEEAVDELNVPEGFFNDEGVISGNGTSITLNDTAYAKLKDIKIYGDTQQDGTPTPESPIDVQVVTGEQTIIVSDNSQQSQSYTISLGDIKLCKLGTARDYIYKNGARWFIHRETGEWSINPNDSWYSSGTHVVKCAFANSSIVNVKKSDNNALCASFATATASSLYNGTVATGFAIGSDGLYFSNNDMSVSQFKNWLNENPTALYYVLNDTVEEEITDYTLISQLEALSQANSYNGTTHIGVSGSLPAPIYVEAFKNGWSGTIAGVNNELENVYTKSETDKLIDDKAQFIFPKFWPSVASGDCNLIKYRGKNILIDCYTATALQYVRAMLTDNDVKHIDVFICSHYHTDHIGNFEQLVEDGYIDADTKLFMPAETTNFNWSTEITKYKNLCTVYGLDYYVPYEGEVYTIGDLKMTFNNCDAEAMDATYPQTNGQNNTSTVVLIEHKTVKAYYTGDIGTAAMDRLQALNFPSSSVELFKMAHHGIDQRVNPEYIRQLAPEYAVQPTGVVDDTHNNYGICEQTAVLRGIGTRIYPTHLQENYIIFESNGSAIQCKQGKPYGQSDQTINLTYYVDIAAATTDIQDGSQARPFKELMQAISAIPYKSGVKVTINVADGYYGNPHPLETAKNRIYFDTGKDVKIIINGNSSDRGAVVLNGVYAEHSNFELNNLTIDLDNQTGLTAYDSTIYFGNVAIKSYTDTMALSPHSAILVRENTLVIVKSSSGGLRIDQCHECIIVQTGSRFIANDTVSIGTHDSSILNASRCDVLTDTLFTFDNDADKLSFNGYAKIVKTPLQIMATHEDYAQSVSLVRSSANFSWLEIHYRTNDGNYGNTGKIYSPNGKTVGVYIPHKGTDGTLYQKQCQFAISGSTITITKAVKIHIVDETAPSLGDTTNIDIIRVVAGYSDYIDIAN